MEIEGILNRTSKLYVTYTGMSLGVLWGVSKVTKISRVLKFFMIVPSGIFVGGFLTWRHAFKNFSSKEVLYLRVGLT